MPTRLLLVVLASLAPAGAAQDPLPPARVLPEQQRVRELIAKGDHGRAAAVLEDLVLADDSNGDLYQDLGLCYLRSGKLRQALDALTAAHDLGSGYPPMNCYRIAALHARLGEADAAVMWLEQALELRYVNRAGIAADAAFRSLREAPRFRELAALEPGEPLDRVTGWRLDLDFLMAEIRRMNPRPGGHPDGDAVHAAVEALKARVPELDDNGVVFGIMEVMALLGDGHSGLRLRQAPRLQASFVPVQFRWFEDGLFVTRGRGAGAELVGARVVRVGNLPAEQLPRVLARVVPHENDQGVIANGPLFLRSPELLHHLGVTDDPATVRLEVEGDGRRRQVTLAGEPWHEFPDRAPPETSSQPVPRYLRDTDTALWSEALPDLDAVYVQFNAVSDMPRKTLEQAAAELHRELREVRPRAVIVDVRHNGGGNNFLVKPLIRTLVHFELEREGNKVFVITSRHTYSACQNFVNRLEAIGEPIIVGEPSSSKPNFIGESTHSRLPWSGLHVGISSRYWQDSWPEDSRPWIWPHLPVTLTSEDWFENRDPAMAAIEQAL